MHKIVTTQRVEPHPSTGRVTSVPQPEPWQSRPAHSSLSIFTARMSVSGDSVVVPVSELRNVMSVLSRLFFQMLELWVERRRTHDQAKKEERTRDREKKRGCSVERTGKWFFFQ